MPDRLDEQQRQQIIEALYAGNKISAIKIYRQATGDSLSQSKEFIDALEIALRTENPSAFAHPVAAGCGTTTAVLLFIGILLTWCCNQ
jgi:ribosomal protein L7/L12